MATNGGKIQYTIGFNVDKGGLKELENTLKSLNNMSATDIMKNNPALSMNEARSAMMKLRQSISEVQTAFGKAFDSKVGVLNIEKMQSSLKKLDLSTIQKNFAAIGPKGSQAFLQISQAALTTNIKLKETNSLMNKMGTTLINTLKWTFSSSLINRFTGAIQQAVGYVEHLDSSLNDIRIVTKKSADEMQVFGERANDAAKALGKATTDYTEAALIYYQQGLSDEEVQARAETTLKAANVTGQATKTVSEQLTAVWNGFKVNAEQTEEYVDKLAAVAAMSASNLEELSTGMSKVASAAANLGVDIDQLNAQISTIISVTRQAPESVGTALKTIYARIDDLKLGDTDEDGLGLGDVSGGLKKLGIDVLDAEGELRDLGSVIEEVASHWDTWTSAQQAAIAQLLAGKRQYNNLVALFSNWDMYENAIETSRNATGELQKQQDIYMESTEAHLQQLETQWEDLYDSIIDEDAIIGVADALNSVLTILTKIIDAVGGGKTLITGLIGTVLSKFSPQITQQILMPFINNLQAAKTNAEAFGQVVANAQFIASQNNFGDTATARMVQETKELVEVWDVLTTEEKNQSQEIIRQIGYWEEQKAEIDQNVKALDEYLGKQTSLNNITKKGSILSENVTDANRAAAMKHLEEQKQAVDNITTSYKNFNKVAQEKGTSNNIDIVTKNIAAMEKAGKELKDSELFDSTQVAHFEAALDKVKIRIDKIRNIKQDSKRENTQLFTVKEVQALESIKNILSQVSPELANYFDTLENGAEKTKKINSTLDTLEGGLNKQEIATRRRAQGITQLIGSLTQGIFVLQSLSNVTKTLFDNSLSSGEKFSSLLSSLVFILPSAISLIDTLADAGKKMGGSFASFLTKGKIGLILAGVSAITALVQGIKAANQAKLDKLAEDVDRAAEAAKKHTEALKQEEQELEEIQDKYKDLNKEIADSNITIENARSQIYDLCKKYGFQELAVEALTEDYEKLADVIKKANDEAARKELETLTKEKDAAWTKAIAEANKALGENVLDFTGLGSRMRQEEFGGFDYFDPSAQSYQRQKMYDELTALGVYIDDWGQAKTEDILQVATTSEEALYEIIKKYNIKAATELNDFLKNNKENIEYYRSLLKDEKNQKATIKANEIINPSDITNVEQYVAKQKELKDVLNEVFGSDTESRDEFVNSYLSGIDEIKEYAQQADISSAIIDTTHFTEEEIVEQYGKRSIDEINYLFNNLALANTFESVDAFFEYVEQSFQQQNRKGNVIKADVELKDKTFNLMEKASKENNINRAREAATAAMKESAFSSDMIENLYAGNFGQDSGISKEQFADSTYQEQMGYLVQYYIKANQEERNYQELLKNRGNIEDDAQYQKIKSIQDSLTELANSYQGSFDTAVSEGYQNVLDKMLVTTENNLGLEENRQAILKATNDEIGDLTTEELNYIASLMKEKDLTAEDLAEKAQSIRAYEEYKKVLKDAGIEVEDYDKVQKKLTDGLDQLQTALSDTSDLGIDWANATKLIDTMITQTNQSIDNMQSAYNSLNSIVEDYNETQVLSMDNLQTILQMDTAYLQALEFENGQMVVNEQALTQIALARLDEAEAEAYEQAMAELLNDDLRNQYNATMTASQGLYSLGNAASAAADAARAGVDDWNAYWAAATQGAGVSYGAYEQAVGNALRTKLQAIGTVREQIQSGKFRSTVGSSSGGSKSKSGGSSKQPQTEKYLEREEDIYRKINEELDQIESTLGRIDTMASHEWGYDYQKTLEEQNKLLDQQLKKLQEKNKLQVKDLATRRKQLEDVGVTFSEDGGVMNNAEQILNGLYTGYNSMVDKYNKMSASGQETYKAQLETEKNRIDAIEKKIDEYESTYSDFQSTLDELQDVHYQQIENEVNQFNNMVDVHLELNDARKEWNTFWKEVIEDVQDTDFGGQVAASLKQLEVLTGLGGDVSKSTIGLLTDQLNKTTAEVNKQIATAAEGGVGSIFGDDSAKSKENLTNRINQLMSALRDAKSEVEAIGDNYIKQLEEEQKLVDKQADAWNAIDKHLEHNIELIKLLDGEKAFDALNTQYEKQYENNLNSITTQRLATEDLEKKVKEYKEWMETAEKGSIEWQTASKAYDEAVENYIKATENLDSAIIKALNDLKEQTENANAKAIDTLDKAISGGLGMDLVEEEWKLINDEANKYYDNVERYLNMEEYTNLLNDAANAIGLSAENQQKLNQFRDQELAQLNEKTKLTSYDIEESKARLEILKAQIALEDAQANKSKMRLRRDSQGNYNYQYVADESAVNEGENGVLTAKKSWYEIVKKRYQETSNDIIEIQKQQLELANQIKDAESQHDIERLNKLKELYNSNEKYREQRMAEAEKNKRDLYNGTAQYFANVENASILPQSEATVRKLIDEWAGEGKDSFVGAVKTAVTELDSIQAQFVQNSDKILTTANRNYQELKSEGIDPTLKSLKDLAGTNDELADKMADVNEKLAEMAKNLGLAEAGYTTLKDSAAAALTEAQKSLETLADTYIKTQEKINAAVNSASSASSIPYNQVTPSSSSSGGGAGGSGSGSSLTNSSNTVTSKKPYLAVNYPDNKNQWPTWAVINPDRTTVLQRGEIHTQTDYDHVKKIAPTMANYNEAGPGFSVGIGGKTWALRKLKGTRVKKQWATNVGYVNGEWPAFRSGGYTGEWGNDGRLAVLHQKELVLNEDDTKNILSAVQILRSIPYSVIAQSLVNSSMNTASALSGINSGISGLSAAAGGDTTKTMVVNADFSGVHDADEIYQALVELENYGLQNSYSVAPHANSMY